MIRITTVVIVLSIIAQSGATTAQDSARVLRAAMTTETVDGNLELAIEQYRKVVAGADRQRAAVALLRIAGCYERLGDPAARSTYLEVVARYPEQLEAVAAARARLGQVAAAVTKEPSLSRVWAGTRSSTLLADGRRISYDDAQNLVILPADGSVPRVLTQQTAPGAADHSAGWRVSPDGRQLAYSWYTAKGRYDLRVISLEGAGVAKPRVLYDRSDVNAISPRDWSPDGRLIAAAVDRKDRGSELVLVDTGDGSLRRLETSAWHQSDAYFSPDGRSIAFDAAVAGGQTHDIRLLALNGRGEVAVARHEAHDQVSGWTADGHLLFTSDRRGSKDLWLQPFVQGQPSGEPRMVYANLGDKQSTGSMTADGGLYLEDLKTDTDVLVASVDLSTGKTLAVGARVGGRFLGINEYPDWSRDGRFLAFLASRSDGRTLVMQNADTGATVRELRVPLTASGSLRWSPDGRAFVLTGTDGRGRIGVFRIDAESGAVASVATPRDDFWRGFRPEWSADGNRIYYSVPSSGGSKGIALIEHDLATGKEREILRRTSTANQIHRDINFSPDGRVLASTSEDGRAVVLYTLAGGAQRREIYRAPDDRRVAPTMAWTPDGQGVVIRTVGPERAQQLWVVSLDGRAPVKLELSAPDRDFRLHPDGRRITFTVLERRSEVWLLQNFLPKDR